MTGADVRLVRQMQREDADPSKWPVRGSFREFMIECKRCKSRFAAVAQRAHNNRGCKNENDSRGIPSTARRPDRE